MNIEKIEAGIHRIFLTNSTTKDAEMDAKIILLGLFSLTHYSTFGEFADLIGVKRMDLNMIASRIQEELNND